MEFCCNNFEGGYFVQNNFGINIRIVKFSSHFLVNQGEYFFRGKKSRLNNKRNDIKFFMTMGYEKFSFDLAMANINFCPFCGKNLHDFYNKDEYANEIEGETFKL